MIRQDKHEIFFRIIATFLQPTALALLVVGLLIYMAEAGADEQIMRQLRSHHPRGAALNPHLPAEEVQLILDDGSAELDFGLVGLESVPFLWMNRFEVDVPFELEQIWVLFPQDPALEEADIEWVVFQGDNGDPRDGAQLHRASAANVQAVDGVTFSIFSVEPPVTVTEPYVYLGVISRYAEMATPPTFPAALDVDGAGGQSWIVVWLGDPPIPPTLPGDDETFLIDDIIPGYWMIRGFGRPLETPSPLEISALSGPAQTLLAVWLALAALVFLRRHRRQASFSSESSSP